MTSLRISLALVVAVTIAKVAGGSCPEAWRSSPTPDTA